MGDKDDGMQCREHPYRSNAGGICAFCLQDKLGKLIATSKMGSFYPTLSAAASSPTSPAKDAGGWGLSAKFNHHPGPCLAQKQRVPFSSSGVNHLLFKRSRSTTVPRQSSMEERTRKKGFWSFLHRKAFEGRDQKEKVNGDRSEDGSKFMVAEEEYESPNSSHSSSFERKVARSRSVGCGSRSFSGDFLERISSGFGDCALRRIQSQREPKPKPKPKIIFSCVVAEDRIGDRVRCGGLFSGFVSSSSSSSYSVSDDVNGRIPASHHRSRSWAWALTSPIRAFKPSRPRPAQNARVTRPASGNRFCGSPSLLTVRV